MIMGLGMQLVAWPDEMVRGLAARGFRVIRFDNIESRLENAGAPAVVTDTLPSYITSTSHVKRRASDAWRGVICGTPDTSTVWNCVASSR